jgi:hypothetical protein
MLVYSEHPEELVDTERRTLEGWVQRSLQVNLV